MRLVAVWQRLRGRGVGRDIIGHLLFSGRRLLRGGTESRTAKIFINPSRSPSCSPLLRCSCPSP
jgi:hypothetical protein